MLPAHPSEIVRFVLGTSAGLDDKSFLSSFDAALTQLYSPSSRQVSYDSTASNLITNPDSTQTGFSSSQFFTYRSPRAETLTHIQVFIRVNRCERCAWGSERAYLKNDFSYSLLIPSVPEQHNHQEYRDLNEMDV